MSLVHLPLSSAEGALPRAGGTVRTMTIGQHVMAVLLSVIGAVRAVAAGVGWPVAVAAAVAVVAWHTAGAALARRSAPPRVVVGWLVGLVVVWVGAVVVSSEFVWLAFLLWLLAGHLLPLRWGLLLSVGVLVVTVGAPLLHHGTTSYADVLGPLVGGVFAFAISRGYLQLLRDAAERERLLTSLTRAQQEMSDLQDELALAQRESGAIAERIRISRDLHDTVAQELSSIRLLSHAGSQRSDDPDATRTLALVESLAADSLSAVRRIIAALAPAELDDAALVAALQRMLDRARAEVGLATELHVDESLPQLPTTVEVALLRTAQSALANVRLHSAARRVVVSLVDDDGTVRLDITDDGVGFDLAGWERAGETSGSYGLRFMRARLRDLGGGLDIDSSPGAGTSVSAHVPFERFRAEPVQRVRAEPINPEPQEKP
ncbi:sensor histidine kinase [Aestuariimicrobium sp. Y1814]|uniref:sensor histidine kinase n=1 Tax=Aestuariimicrobium sp. Y1814 TaxID=3418742 RepID=UPI003DA787E9